MLLTTNDTTSRLEEGWKARLLMWDKGKIATTKSM